MYILVYYTYIDYKAIKMLYVKIIKLDKASLRKRNRNVYHELLEHEGVMIEYFPLHDIFLANDGYLIMFITCLRLYWVTLYQKQRTIPDPLLSNTKVTCHKLYWVTLNPKHSTIPDQILSNTKVTCPRLY